MAKKKQAKGTGQANFKFPPDFMKRVRAYAEEHPWKPSMTRLFIKAMDEYMERNPLHAIPRDEPR